MSTELDEVATTVQVRFGTNEPKASFVVSVVEGPDCGSKVLLDGSQRILVGAGPACQLRLTDRAVSRRHAALEIDGDRLNITDLGSTNGTRVLGLAIAEAWLQGGETLRVGSTVLQVERGAPQDVELSSESAFGQMLGVSAEMRRLYPLCRKLAESSMPVVIEGETGTGKEILAESLHQQGPRASGPFVVFDCTAVPDNLIESELFGHEKGAFSGAVTRRTGLFEVAKGGTLLIDEIGELRLDLQAKLLRAIERSEVRPVGSNTPRHVDVRVLAATRRNLDREIQAGRFRDDLFHRLAVGRIELPPLRRRRGDIFFLGCHFAAQSQEGAHSIPSDLLRQWEDHNWPGNVRELRNAVVRHLALGEIARVAPCPSEAEEVAPESAETAAGEDLIATLLGERIPYAEARDRLFKEFTRRYVLGMLEAHSGNVTRAAAASGLARRYFQILRGKLEPG